MILAVFESPIWMVAALLFSPFCSISILFVLPNWHLIMVLFIPLCLMWLFLFALLVCCVVCFPVVFDVHRSSAAIAMGVFTQDNNATVVMRRINRLIIVAAPVM